MNQICRYYNSKWNLFIPKGEIWICAIYNKPSLKDISSTHLITTGDRGQYSTLKISRSDTWFLFKIPITLTSPIQKMDEIFYQSSHTNE